MGSAVRLIVVWPLSRRRLAVVTRRRYHGEDGRVGEVLVEGSEIRTSVFVVVQVAEVVRVAIVGVGDRVRIDGVVVTYARARGHIAR